MHATGIWEAAPSGAKSDTTAALYTSPDAV